MNSMSKDSTRHRRLSSLFTQSQCSQSERSDGTLPPSDAPQSRGRRALSRLTSMLSPQQSLPMPSNEESESPTITTLSIAVMSAVDDRPFYKLEDPASIHHPYVRHVPQEAFDICYSKSNGDNPMSTRAELSTLIDHANYDIEADRLLQIKQQSLPADASLIVIQLMPSVNYDSDDSEGDLRSAPGQMYRNPCGQRDRYLSDTDRTQLQVFADTMRARGTKLGDTLEYKGK